LWIAKKHSLEQRAAAANLLKGKKDRRQESNNPQFQGDYMSFDKNYGLQEALGPNKDERVVFADQVIKINRRMKPERRDLIVSVEAVSLIMRTRKLNKDWYKLIRRTPLRDVQSCSLSTLKDNFVVIHCPPTDLLIECSHKTEMLAVMLEYYQKLTGRQFALNFSNSISYTIPGGDTRQLSFAQDGSCQRPKLKKAGRQLTISIAPGIGKDADTAPKMLVNVGQGVSKPVGGRGAPVGGRAGGQAGGQVGGQVGAAVQTTPAGGGIQAGLGAILAGRAGGAGAANPVAPRPVQPPQPAQVAKPMAKALYNYQGATQDELSFSDGDLIAIIKKDPGGWWEGELKGRRGWMPANYVQEQ